MPIAIAVTSQDLVLAPLDPHTPPAAVVPAPHDQPLDAALAQTQTLLDQHGHVVVVYAAGGARSAVHHRLHTVRSILETDRIALLGFDLPPLALAVLALQLRQLSVRDVSPGVLASAARLLAHYIHAGALLSTVAKLDRIPVSLTSHASSWVPGSQFAALVHPTRRLVRLGAPDGDRLPGPDFATRLVVAGGRLQSDWVTGTLAPAWRVQGVREVALPDDSAGWWGTAKLVEFAAAIPDTELLHQIVASVRRDRCHWCGLDLIGERCAFCSAPLTPPSPPLALAAP